MRTFEPPIETLAGPIVRGPGRRGKWIMFVLDDGLYYARQIRHLPERRNCAIDSRRSFPALVTSRRFVPELAVLNGAAGSFYVTRVRDHGCIGTGDSSSPPWGHKKTQ